MDIVEEVGIIKINRREWSATGVLTLESGLGIGKWRLRRSGKHGNQKA
jgi:hypothetical protein